MITGVVRAREARLRLIIRGPGGQEQEIEAVIDTGYTASLTLPAGVVAALGLPWQSVGSAILADGSNCLFNVYEAKVVWDRRARRVFVDETGATPLVGMGLLSGYELKMQVRARGKVAIKRLP